MDTKITRLRNLMSVVSTHASLLKAKKDTVFQTNIEEDKKPFLDDLIDKQEDLFLDNIDEILAIIKDIPNDACKHHITAPICINCKKSDDKGVCSINHFHVLAKAGYDSVREVTPCGFWEYKYDD